MHMVIYKVVSWILQLIALAREYQSFPRDALEKSSGPGEEEGMKGLIS